MKLYIFKNEQFITEESCNAYDLLIRFISCSQSSKKISTTHTISKGKMVYTTTYKEKIDNDIMEHKFIYTLEELKKYGK